MWDFKVRIYHTLGAAGVEDCVCVVRTL